VRESSSVRVSNGSVLRESEINGAVSDGEGWKLNGVDGDFWILWFENSVVYYEDDNDDENQEDCSYYT
jgi:hypothetical protein